MALGAEKFVDWEYHKQTARPIKQLKKQGYKIVALEQAEQSVAYYDFKIKSNEKIALLLGSEVKGLPPRLLRTCDAVVEIPMHGQKESLNVGIAAGVVMFEFVKKVN